MIKHTVAMSLLWAKGWSARDPYEALQTYMSLELYQEDDIKETELPLPNEDFSFFDPHSLQSEDVIIDGSIKVLTEGKLDEDLTSKLQTLLKNIIDNCRSAWFEMNLPE